MAYTTNATSNKVPAFGVPGTVTPSGGSAKTWDIMSITVTPGNDLVEHRDANGMIASRTYYNNDSTGENRSTTISITAIPVGAARSNAASAADLLHNGTIFAVASADIAVANGNWEVTSMTWEGANTDNATITLNGVWATANT